MNIIVTAGPTREYIDDVRFITNASSGRMGYAVAAAASEAGHEVTLLSGPVRLAAPEGVALEQFISVGDLQASLGERFASCDALVMAAAVGDFTPVRRVAGKLPRRDGPVNLTLVPTEDVLAGVAGGKKPGQWVVAFAVETGERQAIEAKARAELAAKHADMVVLNTPAAMDAEASEATILTAEGAVLPWANRSKADLAGEIIRAIEEAAAGAAGPRVDER
jgi:phosphopantothenoylcysteine decarboxylase/phosphopantothenate--cysteine ligase